ADSMFAEFPVPHVGRARRRIVVAMAVPDAVRIYGAARRQALDHRNAGQRRNQEGYPQAPIPLCEIRLLPVHERYVGPIPKLPVVRRDEHAETSERSG